MLVSKMNSKKTVLLIHVLLCLGLFPLSGVSFAGVTDTEIYLPDDLETFDPPAAGDTYIDTTFGTAINRLTDARNTSDATDPVKTLNLISQESSGVSPFNVDNSRLLLQHFSYFGLYDGLGNYLDDLPFEITASSEPRWSQTDPAVFYYINGNQLKQYDVLTGNVTILHVFDEYTSISGKGGANLSVDGDHLLLIGDNIEVFVYTLSSGTSGPVLELANAGDLDGMMITPDNNVLVIWDQSGAEERFNGTELFDGDMNFLQQVATVGGNMDVTRNADGDEILLWANAGEATPDPDCSNGVFKIHLADNNRTCMLSLDWGMSLNISAAQTGDVFYVSTRGPSPDAGWRVYQNEILRVDIDGQQIERLLHHRSKPSDGFYDHAKVSVSRDGSRMVYSSNHALQSSLGYPANYTDVYFVCNIAECNSPVHVPVAEPEPPQGPPIHVPDDLETFEPPAVGGSYTDPIFGTVITRLTDSQNTINSASDDNSVLDFISHEYSTMSAFNVDNSRMLLQHFSYFALYDGLGNYLSDLPFDIGASSEPRWSRDDPAVLYYLNGNQIRHFNIQTNVDSLLREFPEYSVINSRGEADLSFDGNHLVFFGDNKEIFVYTLSTDSKGPVLFIPNPGDANSLYLTPDNNVLVTWDDNGSSRYNGIELYDRNMTFLRQIAMAGGHMDVARDANGDEVLLWANAGESNSVPVCVNGIVKIRLEDADRTCLLSLGWGMGLHISAPQNGDGFYVSTHGPSPDANWRAYQNEILKMSMDGQELNRLLHSRSKPSDGYYDQPKVSVSRDGSRLIYASNFGLQASQNYPLTHTDVYFVCNMALCESPALPVLPPPDESSKEEPPPTDGAGDVSNDLPVIEFPGDNIETPPGNTSSGNPPIEAPALVSRSLTNKVDNLLSPQIDLSTYIPAQAGQFYFDVLYGTWVRRLTDASNTPDQSFDGDRELQLIGHEYSTISAFNSDSSRLLLLHFSYFALYDGEGNYLRDLPFEINASSEPRWSRADPSVLYFINGNLLKIYHTESGVVETVREFTEYRRISSLGEADISFDGDHLVLRGDNTEIFVYTLSTDSKGAVLASTSGDAISLYMTPDNNVLITWSENGSGRFQGIELFDQQMRFMHQLTTAGGHMDVARDVNGEEILLWANAGQPVTDPNCSNGVVKIQLRNNEHTCLIELDWSLGLHISAPEILQGWFVISTYLKGNDSQESNSAPIEHRNEILEVSLDGSQVRGLALHWSRDNGSYYFQPRASVSVDGERIVFDSNLNLQQSLGYPEEYTDAYLLCLASCDGFPDMPEIERGWLTAQDGNVELFRYQEYDAELSYEGAWDTLHSTGFSGGAARLAELDARMTFSFYGSAVSWFGYSGPWGGKAIVTLDAEDEMIIDTYAANHQIHTRLLTVIDMEETHHTLTIEVLAPASGTGKRWVWIDGIDAYPCPPSSLCSQ